MPDFSDLSKLEEYLLNKIEKVMINEVADVIKKEESKQIKRYYQQFRPKMYERREDNGGLSDIRNMRVKPPRRYKHSVSVTITNETKGNREFSDNPTNDLDKVFATGLGYDYHGETSKYYERPRPANEDACEELNHNRRVVSELIAGLQKEGIQCE